jgi:hypothetical protein
MSVTCSAFSVGNLAVLIAAIHKIYENMFMRVNIN